MADETKSAWVATFVERLGLPSVILIGVGWFGYQGVVAPMAQTYREVIQKVGETNELLRQEVETNDREDGERVVEIGRRFDEVNAKLDRLLEK